LFGKRCDTSSSYSRPKRQPPYNLSSLILWKSYLILPWTTLSTCIKKRTKIHSGNQYWRTCLDSWGAIRLPSHSSQHSWISRSPALGFKVTLLKFGDYDYGSSGQWGVYIPIN